jgi:hypothetical protein
MAEEFNRKVLLYAVSWETLHETEKFPVLIIVRPALHRLETLKAAG